MDDLQEFCLRMSKLKSTAMWNYPTVNTSLRCLKHISDNEALWFDYTNKINKIKTEGTICSYDIKRENTSAIIIIPDKKFRELQITYFKVEWNFPLVLISAKVKIYDCHILVYRIHKFCMHTRWDFQFLCPETMEVALKGTEAAENERP